MLIPTLYIEDLRDKPTVLRITDVTEGYGLNGNPTRAQISRATLRIEKWSSVSNPNQVVWEGEMPIEFIRDRKSIEVPYSIGSDLGGDGMIVVYLCLFSKFGIPLVKSTYTATFPALTSNQRLLVERDGAWVLVAGSIAKPGITTYIENQTPAKLTRWRIEESDSSITHSGVFAVTDVFSSGIEVTTSTEAKLVAQSGQQIVLLGRTRRLLNEISEKIVFEDCASDSQLLGESLVWLRVYEQLIELGLSDYGTASPLRVLTILSDLQRTLNQLWLRRG